MNLLIVLFTVLLIGLFPVIGATSEPVEIIAHRGSSYEAPENTVASSKLAWSQKADAVELDIYLTPDGRIMVMHDGSTARTTGVNFEFSKTNSMLLRELDAGSWKGAKYAHERIPFFEEILKEVPRGGNLYIEIKCGAEVLPALRQAIKQSRKTKQMRIIGFNLDVMTACKKLMPEIPAYWLASNNPATPYGPKLIEMAKERKLDGLDLHFGGVDQALADAVKAADMKLYIWTVDDAAEAKRLAALGVAGITTNRPDFLRKELGL
ncbi:MAG: glycerophosphodiester phosphodiesterase [Armatimonadota bacterium]